VYCLSREYTIWPSLGTTADTPSRPQSTPAAVAHLCTSTKATHLVYDASLHALATDARSIIGSERLSLVALPVSSTWDPAGRDIVPMSRALSPAAESAMTCIIYHSSGTTSGLPKPLPQAHRTMTALHPHIPGSPAVFRYVPLPFSMAKGRLDVNIVPLHFIMVDLPTWSAA
jgi:hypothetical protein